MAEVRTIGQAAQSLGISPKTIRYYETIGLLPEMERAENGYRQLRDNDVNRLRFIRRAKSLGLKLDEIRTLTSVAEEGECSRITTELKQILETKIRACNEQIESLSALRTSLEHFSHQIIGHSHDHDHDHHHDHHHGSHSHPPFSPECTCLPDAP